MNITILYRSFYQSEAGKKVKEMTTEELDKVSIEVIKPRVIFIRVYYLIFNRGQFYLMLIFFFLNKLHF